MAPILSACMVMYRCGDEIDVALRCIQNADLEVSVFLCDNSPDEMTAERLKWAFPGIVVLPQKKTSGSRKDIMPYCPGSKANTIF